MLRIPCCRPFCLLVRSFIYAETIQALYSSGIQVCPSIDIKVIVPAFKECIVYVKQIWKTSVILFALMCRVNPIFTGISSMPQFLPEGLYIPHLTEMAASQGRGERT